MRRLKLTQGQVAVVDDDDYARLSRYKWYVKRRVRAGRVDYRACRCAYPDGRVPVTILLHRDVARAAAHDIVDHVNGDPLDCRKANLRKATPSQNQTNHVTARRSSSRYFGVSWCARSGKWHAQGSVPNPSGVGRGKRVHLGYYSSQSAAALAYNLHAEKHYGVFARFNDV